MCDGFESPPTCPVLGGKWPHFTGVPNRGGQEQHKGVHPTEPSPRKCSQEGAHCPSYLSMPCRSLKLSFSSGCCGLPALSMNTRRDGALLRTCQRDE